MPFNSGEIEAVKQASPIEDVISQYLALRKHGKEYLGLCPFHDDKRPSLQINPQKGIFKCFACGVGGSVFDFLMNYERVSFPEALSLLAERAGIPLSSASPEEASQRKNMYSCLELAAKFFQSRLSGEPREYVSSRGIKPETAEKFRLGYAPDSWDSLLHFLSRGGFSEHEILQVGLVVAREQSSGSYDRFRNRIMFPIFDMRGKIIGFSGRALDPSDRAKYLNSPETPLFSKSKVLYGLNFATRAILDTGEAIVVEGYTDVVLSHQAELENVVSTMGTSLTEEHVKLLCRRFPDAKVIVSFDGDDAGRRGALVASERILGRGSSFVCFFPKGKDPADILSAGEDLSQYTKIRTPVSEFFIDENTRDLNLGTLEGQTSLIQRVSPALVQLPPDTLGVCIDYISSKTGINPDSLECAVFGTDYKAEMEARMRGERDFWEDRFVIGLLRHPETVAFFENKISPEMFSSPVRRLVVSYLVSLNNPQELDFQFTLFHKDRTDAREAIISLAQKSNTPLDESSLHSLDSLLGLNPKAYKIPVTQKGLEKAAARVIAYNYFNQVDQAIRGGVSLDKVIEASKIFKDSLQGEV